MIRLAKIAKMVLNELHFERHAEDRLSGRFDYYSDMTQGEKDHLKKAIDALKNTIVNGKDSNVSRIYGDGTTAFGIILFKLSAERKSDQKEYDENGKLKQPSQGEFVFAIGFADDKFKDGDGRIQTLYYEKYLTTIEHFNKRDKVERPQKLLTMDPHFKLHEVPSNFYSDANGIKEIELGKIFDMVADHKKTIIDVDGNIDNLPDKDKITESPEERVKIALETTKTAIDTSEKISKILKLAEMTLKDGNDLVKSFPTIKSTVSKIKDIVDMVQSASNTATNAVNRASRISSKIEDDPDTNHHKYKMCVDAAREALNAYFEVKDVQTQLYGLRLEIDKKKKEEINKMIK